MLCEPLLPPAQLRILFQENETARKPRESGCRPPPTILPAGAGERDTRTQSAASDTHAARPAAPSPRRLLTHIQATCPWFHPRRRSRCQCEDHFVYATR